MNIFVDWDDNNRILQWRPFMNKSFSVVIDACRWMAAFFVVIAHARHIIFVDYKDVENKTLFVKFFYFITGLGHEAVIVFFVISGLLVGGLTLRKWREKVSFTDYFISRFSRIYIVLLPALLVGGCLDWMGYQFFNHSEIYTDSSKYHTVSMNFVVTDRLNLGVFLGNLLMVQTVLVPTFGSNAPLWSLANEWWYYMIFAVCAGAILSKTVLSKIMAVLFLCVVAVYLPFYLLLMMLVWFLGIVVYWYGESSLQKPSKIMGFILFLMALIVSRISHNTDNVANPESVFLAFSRDFAFAFAFALFLLSQYGRDLKNKVFMNRCHHILAEFSYSIYLIHFPALVFLVAIFADVFSVSFMRQPDLLGLLYFCGVVSVLYLFGYCFSRATERYTSLLAFRLKEKLSAK